MSQAWYETTMIVEAAFGFGPYGVSPTSVDAHHVVVGGFTSATPTNILTGSFDAAYTTRPDSWTEELSFYIDDLSDQVNLTGTAATHAGVQVNTSGQVVVYQFDDDSTFWNVFSGQNEVEAGTRYWLRSTLDFTDPSASTLELSTDGSVFTSIRTGFNGNAANGFLTNSAARNYQVGHNTTGSTDTMSQTRIYSWSRAYVNPTDGDKSAGFTNDDLLQLALGTVLAVGEPADGIGASNLDVFAGTVEVGGSWVDITEWVREPILSNRGRTSEYSPFAPGSLSLVLDNRDRRFDPTHAAGPYFGDLNPMTPVRVRNTYDATTYPVFYGFALGFPQQLGKGYTDGTAQVRCIDAFRLLSNASLAGCPFRNEVINDGATHYWPLQTLTPTDQALFVDEIGNADLSIQPIEPLSGGSAFPLASDSLGSTNIGFPLGYPSAPRLRLYDAGSSTYVSDYLVAPAIATTPAYGLEFWANITATGNDEVHVSYVDADDASNLQIIIDADGFTARFADFVGNVGFDGLITDRTWAGVHHYAIWNDGTDLIGYVDGQEIGRATPSFPFTSTRPVGRPLMYVAQRMNTDDPTDVSVSNIAVYGAGTEPDWLTHYIAGLTGYGHPMGEGTGERIGRWLDEIDWPDAQRDLSPGDTVVGPYETPGQALTLAREMETVERGLFFIARDGDVTFRDRNWQFTRTNQATFGDDGTDLPFRDIRPDANMVDAIRNEVTVRWANGEITKRDDTSVDSYGSSDETIAARSIPTQVTAQNLAAYIVRTRKDPATRIEYLKILPRRDPAALFPVVLGLELGDLITVELTPLNVGDPTSYVLAVQGIRHVITRKSWETDLYLAPADVGPYFTVGDATLGRIGATADNRIPY